MCSGQTAFYHDVRSVDTPHLRVMNSVYVCPTYPPLRVYRCRLLFVTAPHGGGMNYIFAHPPPTHVYLLRLRLHPRVDWSIFAFPFALRCMHTLRLRRAHDVMWAMICLDDVMYCDDDMMMSLCLDDMTDLCSFIVH